MNGDWLDRLMEVLMAAGVIMILPFAVMMCILGWALLFELVSKLLG